MSAPHRRRNIIGWVIDLTVLGIAWGFTIFALWDVWLNRFYANWPLLTMLLIPAANVIWLQLRLNPRIVALAFRPRREELALTFMPARKYLTARLKWPIIRALASSLTTAPCLVLAMLWVGYDVGLQELFTYLAGMMGIIIFGLALAVCGVFDLLIRQCRSVNIGGVSSMLIPFVWSLCIIASLTGFVVLYVIMALEFAYPSGFSGIREVLILLGSFCIGLTIIFWRSGLLEFRRRQENSERHDAKASAIFCFLIPVIWSVFAIAPPIGLLSLAVLELTEIIQEEFQIILALFMIFHIFAGFSLIFTIKRWRKAVEVYYRFD